MQPEISVIMTTYNTASYVQRAVDSALSQEGVSVEVVIVDDVSSDNTWEVVSALTDPRIKAKRQEQNGGPSIARNTAISMASGQWFVVLDSDDAFEPGRLARMLAKAKAQQADIVVDNLTVYREADGATFPMFASMPATLDLAGFIRGNQSFLGGYTLGYVKPLFSRAFLEQHKLAYDPSIRIGEDYFLLASALALGAKCVVDASCGYRYTVRAGSISQRLQLKDVERFQACDAKLLATYKLDDAALTAQRKRSRNLLQAFAFTQLVDALKAKNIKGVACILARNPLAALPLWRPVQNRLLRLMGRSARK